MNKLEQTTQELLEAGYTIEEIKADFEEVIEQAKQSNIERENNDTFHYCWRDNK